jgi:hypothetical protein
VGELRREVTTARARRRYHDRRRLDIGDASIGDASIGDASDGDASDADASDAVAEMVGLLKSRLRDRRGYSRSCRRARSTFGDGHADVPEASVMGTPTRNMTGTERRCRCWARSS